MSGETCSDEVEDRARKYILGLEVVLEKLAEKQIKQLHPRLFDAIERYVSDAQYYLDKGDCVTALVNASYAEGLVDSLKYMGILEPEWPRMDKRRPRVVVAGTFDIIHPGHIELFRHASSLGDLYVIVSRDVNAVKAKRRPLVLDEETRFLIVSSIRYVKKAILGDPDDIFKPLERIRPDIIVLGPDQQVSEEQIKMEMRKRVGYEPTVTRYPSKKKHGWITSSSDIIDKICKQNCPH